MGFINLDLDKVVKEVGSKVGEAVNTVGNVADEVVSASVKVVDDVTQGAIDFTSNTYDKAKGEVINAIDQNGNGEIDIEDVIILGLKTPGVRISRASFLKKELEKHCSQAAIEDAICNNPMQAGIDPVLIDKLADETIEYERRCVSGISMALGMPGGAAMAATIPADIAQYYGYMLRATQKLLYLYGFDEIQLDENQQVFDTETINILIICLGVMYGVANASNALKAMANALGRGVQKQLMNKALTKGTIYPIVKSISKWFGVKMTKEIFSNFFKKAIPVVGGVIGGGITYLSFKPCCDKLKDSLKDTLLSNKNHISNKEEKIIEAQIVEKEEK